LKVCLAFKRRSQRILKNRRRIADEEIFLGGFFSTGFSLLGGIDRLLVAGVSDFPRCHGSSSRRASDRQS
jgi:hypothetical protein